MKSWLASVFAALGLSQSAVAGSQVQTVDPKTILLTVPTISDDLAPLDPVSAPPTPADPQMHEDDWCQVEFFRKEYLGELQRMLEEYKKFEVSNRQMTTIKGQQYPVWRNAYVRKVERKSLLTGKDAVTQLARLVGGEIGPATILFSSSSVSGRVKSGFTIHVGTGVELYGYTQGEGVPVLAASVGPNPDDQSLVRAFTKLNASFGLVLVDWKSQFILLGTTPEGKVQAWQPQ
jgi:hypothetical protein